MTGSSKGNGPFFGQSKGNRPATARNVDGGGPHGNASIGRRVTLGIKHAECECQIVPRGGTGSPFDRLSMLVV